MKILQTAAKCFFSSLFFVCLSLYPVGFSEQPDQPSYEKLLEELRPLRKSGEFETRQELVQRNWKTGVLVNAFVRDRAPNSEVHELLVKLERDLGKGQRYFADVRDFARDYPAGAPDIDLPWTYFTVTASMTDSAQREALLRQAVTEHWDTRRLEREAWKARFGEVKEELPALEAQLGRPGIYRIVLHPNLYLGAAPSGDKDTPVRRLTYELGFDTYRVLSPEETKKFKEGDIVQCGISDPGSKIPDSGETKHLESCILHPESVSSDLFTRRAKILKILDGDSVTANIDLGFGVETIKKMRLRGIDAPELDTEAGPAAKAYLEKLLAPGDLLVRAEKGDKYNRTLADLWACPPKSECIYLNRKMLADGQAVAMQE